MTKLENWYLQNDYHFHTSVKKQTLFEIDFFLNSLTGLLGRASLFCISWPSSLLGEFSDVN